MFPTAKTIQDIDSAKLDVADVVDDLTSTDTDKALSANQGKVLQDNKEPADATILKEADIVDNLTSTSTTAPLSANQGKVLQDGKLNLSGGTMTGDLTIPDKIIHSGDTNTAIRFPANDTVTVETGGVEMLRASSTEVVVNETGGNFDFRVEGDTNSNLLFVDASTDRVGIGTTSPESELDVQGAVHITDLSTTNTKLIFLASDDVPRFELINSGTQTMTIGYRGPSAPSRPNLGEIRVLANSPLTFSTDNTERLRITSAGNVGIGTTSPATKLDVNGDVTITDKIIHSGDTNTAIRFPAADTVTFETAGSERMRIDSSGNVGIGTTSPASKLDVYSSGGANLALNHSISGGTYPKASGIGLGAPSTSYSVSSDGGTIAFQGGAGLYAESTASSGNPTNLVFWTGLSGTPSEAMRITSAGVVQPGADNTKTLGSASFRWSEVFAGNGTINTSDATEKQDVAELSESEQQVATALKGLIRKYRWISSVEKKGDDARIHVGVMAQDVKQAFTEAGLDAEQYGVYCKDVWYTKEETYTEQVENPDFDAEQDESEINPRMIDGDEKTRTVNCESDDPDATEHVRYGVRYDQLFAFIISAL
jgi:hypothetical protein